MPPPPFLKDFERAELEREHKCVGGGGFYLFREFGLMERQMARVWVDLNYGPSFATNFTVLTSLSLIFHMYTEGI